MRSGVDHAGASARADMLRLGRILCIPSAEGADDEALDYFRTRGLLTNTRGCPMYGSFSNGETGPSCPQGAHVAGVDTPGPRTDFCGGMHELGEENGVGESARVESEEGRKASEIAIEVIREEGSVGRLNGSFGEFCRRVPV